MPILVRVGSLCKGCWYCLRAGFSPLPIGAGCGCEQHYSFIWRAFLSLVLFDSISSCIKVGSVMPRSINGFRTFWALSKAFVTPKILAWVDGDTLLDCCVNRSG